MSNLALILASAPISAPEFNAGAELARVTLSLVGIIALILLASWLTKRMQRRPGTAGRRIRCVESFAVGTRERLLLMDADGKRLLISMGPGGMRTLHVYEGVAPEEIMHHAEAGSSRQPAFAELLARWRPRA